MNAEVKERPPYVEFVRLAEEDRDETVKSGTYKTRDVDYAILTPIGSRDRIPRKVVDWFAQLESQVKDERIPRIWLTAYREAYEAWKKGEEIPLTGTPVKGWNLISPSMQENVIAANIRTVEDLAVANAEARQRIGMGANELVEKAKAWLKSMTDHAGLVQENTALKTKVGALEARNDQLESDMKLIKQRLEQLEPKDKAA